MSDRYPLPVEGNVRETPPPPPVAPLPMKAPLAEPLTPGDQEAAKERIIEALHKCFDPEIPVNIYELGLIYDIAIAPTGAVAIKMTLTSPGCPVAGSLPADVQGRVWRSIASPRPRWMWSGTRPGRRRMSEAAKLQLGIDE